MESHAKMCSEFLNENDLSISIYFETKFKIVNNSVCLLVKSWMYLRHTKFIHDLVGSYDLNQSQSKLDGGIIKYISLPRGKFHKILTEQECL